ncbi:MAG: hypothetical protein N2745_09295 [Syntrophorhabdaceae bacterium]|nr:hypothetical protein [Syntrophorhabdaceae bacterium]
MRRAIVIVSLSMIIASLFISCGKKADPRPLKVNMPEGIKDLTGEVKDGVLFLSFSVPGKYIDGGEVKDLEGFKVYKACGFCPGGFELLKEIRLDEKKGYALYEGRLYIYDDELAPGVTYTYKVYPFSKRGTRGDESNTYSITWEKPPPPPRGVSAKGEDRKVHISWEKEEGFRYTVYRLEDGAYPLFPLNPEPLTSNIFSDTDVENGKRYVYEVRKVAIRNGISREGEGVRVQVTPIDNTPPLPPRELKVQKDERGVLLTWREAREADFFGFNVYRIEGAKKKRLNDVPIGENRYVDREIGEERYLSYYVTAVDKSGNESEPSREVVYILHE